MSPRSKTETRTLLIPGARTGRNSHAPEPGRAIHRAMLFGAVRDLAEHRLGFAAGPLLVLRSDGLQKVLRLRPLDEVDGRPAEAAAGEPGAEAARMHPRQLHQQIEFRGAVFEMIARAFVTLKQVLAELLEIVFAQRPRAENHP